MNFKNWKAVSEYNLNAETELLCKAELNRRGLKPMFNTVGKIHKVYFDQRWHDFEFFTLDQTTPKRNMEKRTITNYKCNPDNLCESLYLINKSAKKSRDTKKQKYQSGEHGVTQRSKTRQNKLYDLKNHVVDKMISENLLLVEGYHTQEFTVIKKVYDEPDNDSYYNCNDDYENDYYYEEKNSCNNHSKKRTYTLKEEIKTNYIILYRKDNYTFHKPVLYKPSNIPCLGQIEIISSEQKIKTTIKFNEAVSLLYNGSIVKTIFL